MLADPTPGSASNKELVRMAAYVLAGGSPSGQNVTSNRPSTLSVLPEMSEGSSMQSIPQALAKEPE